MIWTTDYLDQLVSEAEEEISKAVPCLFRRVALDITSGTATYLLPELYLSVINVFWKGRQLDPLSQFELANFDATYLSNPGTPYWYSVERDGPKTIRFYPVPNEDVDSGGSGAFDPTVFGAEFDMGVTTIDSNSLFGTSANNLVIVSYWEAPAVANTILTIPKWISRRLIKEYVLYKAFMREGVGQNFKKSDRHFKKFTSMLDAFKILNTYSQAPIMNYAANLLMFGRRPPRPQLPANFGVQRWL